MFGDASGSRAEETTYLLNCQRPTPRKPGGHDCSTWAFAASTRDERQGGQPSFGREEQAQAERRRRPIGPVVARFAAAATERERPERAGAAHVFLDSIGGRGGVRQGGLTAAPAMAFFEEDARP